MSGEPEITEMVPVLGITSYEDALAHYVGWLGFKLDWEWRAAPGEPVILSISRGNFSIMLNESPNCLAVTWVTVKVNNLEAFADEWNSRRAGSATVVVGPPYDIPSLGIRDPFGNFLDFQQPVSAVEQAARKERKVLMRAFIKGELDQGRPLPSPEAVVEAAGKPIGQAMDILCEFAP